VRVLGRVFEKRAGDEPVDAAVGDALITVMNDRSTAIKSAAMQALGAMRYERALQALTELFQYYRNGDVATAALDAIARIAHAASSPILAAQLASRSAEQRGIAVEGLARIGDRARLADIDKATSGERSESVLLARAFAAVLLGNGSLEPLADGLSRVRMH